MANCEMRPEIGKVSGTLSREVYWMNGKRYIRRTVLKVVNGKQRIYLQHSGPRTTKLSDNEIRARALFEKRQAYVTSRIRNGDKRTKKDLWAEAREMFPKQA